ncbi:unnamed protein product, partial [Musa textilis]
EKWWRLSSLRFSCNPSASSMANAKSGRRPLRGKSGEIQQAHKLEKFQEEEEHFLMCVRTPPPPHQISTGTHAAAVVDATPPHLLMDSHSLGGMCVLPRLHKQLTEQLLSLPHPCTREKR